VAEVRRSSIIGGAGQRQVELPNSKAFVIAMQSIRVRFWRSMITAAGVFLGIAFLSSTFAQSVIAAHPDAYQLKLMQGMDPAQLEAAKIAARDQKLWLVGLSLIVCTVGIANSMLMSVTERFKEIGTMKCLGALDGFIVKLFLMEAGMLGLLASLMGWLVGFLAVLLIGLARDGYKIWAKMPFSEVMPSFFWCLLAGMVLTVIATIFPAIRASKLPPAAALRVEI